MERTNFIQSLAYSKTERVVDRLGQTTKTTSHAICLYETEITTASRSFSLHHIHDVSYRSFSGSNGLFYLHTNEGVFTFEISHDPSLFIQSYKQLRSLPPN